MIETSGKNERPLIVVSENPAKIIQCVISKYDDLPWEKYVQIVCNLSRSIANIFGIDESEVWRQMEREWQVPVPFERLDENSQQ